jgi:hypothetical protein
MENSQCFNKKLNFFKLYLFQFLQIDLDITKEQFIKLKNLISQIKKMNFSYNQIIPNI